MANLLLNWSTMKAGLLCTRLASTVALNVYVCSCPDANLLAIFSKLRLVMKESPRYTMPSQTASLKLLKWLWRISREEIVPRKRFNVRHVMDWPCTNFLQMLQWGNCCKSIRMFPTWTECLLRHPLKFWKCPILRDWPLFWDKCYIVTSRLSDFTAFNR